VVRCVSPPSVPQAVDLTFSTFARSFLAADRFALALAADFVVLLRGLAIDAPGSLGW
jgi:hypothetical protein